MSRQSRAVNSAMGDVSARSAVLVEDYTDRLDTVVNGLIGTDTSIISNSEYAARTSALMIALNRQLARCAAAFGEVHGVSPEEMATLVGSQFNKNYQTALAAVAGEGATVQ